jgi:hypothetical protein
MNRQRTFWGLTAALVVASLVVPTLAWAKYKATGAETNTFVTHVMTTTSQRPGQPSCGNINVLAVPLSWAAPTDTSFVTGYEIGKSNSPGGPYTPYTFVAGTSTTVNVLLSDQYYVVHAMNHQYRGLDSVERHVSVFLGTASC